MITNRFTEPRDDLPHVPLGGMFERITLDRIINSIFMPASAGSRFTSLSSSLLNRVIESDWMTPSKNKLHPIPSEEDPAKYCLKSHPKGPSFSTQIHRAAASVARITSTMAIHLLISPIGFFYHAGHATYYHNINEVRSRHLICMSAELSRIFTAAVTAGLFFTTGSTPFIVQLIVVGCFPPAMLSNVANLFTTVFSPIYTSRTIDPPENDLEWCLKMGFKWELGIELKSEESAVKLLQDVGLEYHKQLLEIVEILQKALPQEHRLPYDPEVNVNRIMQYIEQARPFLSEESWNLIRPLKDELSQIHSRWFSLVKYENLSKWTDVRCFGKPGFTSSNERAIKCAYGVKLEGLMGNPQVKEKLLHQLPVQPLRETLFLKMLSSNWLFPSNVTQQKKVENKGSIVRSLLECDLYENRTVTVQNRCLKTARLVARVMLGAAIFLTGVTLGTTYHSLMTVKHLISYFTTQKDLQFREWQYVTAHLDAAFNDFVTMTIPIDTRGLEDLLNPETRAGLAKSILLKEKFGITDLDGNLLSFNYDEDILISQNQGDPYFTHWHQTRSSKLFYTLQVIYEKNPLLREKLDRSFTDFTQTGNYETILNHIKNSELLNATEVAAKCEQLFLEVLELQEILETCWLKTQRNLKWVAAKTKQYKCPFPFYPYVFRSFSSKESSRPENNHQDSYADTRTDPLSSCITLAIKCIKELQAPQSSNPLYVDCKAKVIRKAEAAELLNLNTSEPITEESVNRAYKKLSLVVHPDRVKCSDNQNKEEMDKIRAEATELFKVLSCAKEKLLAKLIKKDPN